MTRHGCAFKKGDPVKVKDGVACPDYEDMCIAGWQGRVMDVRKSDEGGPLLDIAWDSITLKAMRPAYIENSEEKGLDWAEMSLLADEVEAVAARDSERDVQTAHEDLKSQYGWFGLGKEGRRIHAIIGGINPDDEMAILAAWEAHLKKNLRFPFTAKVSEYQERSPLEEGDKVEVMQIEDVDDFVGLLVEVKCGERKLVFPLCDLTVVGKKDPNCQPVTDYCVWYANR
jgi:hypothetical protein